jgi:hypothetical protein
VRQGALSPSKVTVVARILNDTIHNAGWGPAAANPELWESSGAQPR